MPRPAISEQSLITLRLDASVDAIAALRFQLAEFGYLKRGLMHDLLTGRVRVSVEEPGTT